jgi:diadenosine tetraphosphate (Ap4A) HIT family hydrolase
MAKFTKEENQLLLTDLSARVPYGVKANIPLIEGDKRIYTISFSEIDDFKKGHITIIPYLRPMSSMTDEERTEFYKVGGIMSHKVETDTYVLTAFSPDAYDWLNAHHFDYRGLIEKGLAFKAPKGMYNN